MSCDPSQVEETVTTATETTAEVVAEVTPDPVPDTGFTPQLTPPPAEEEEEEDEVEEECVSALQLVGGQSLTHDNQSAIQSCDFMQPIMQLCNKRRPLQPDRLIDCFSDYGCEVEEEEVF